MTLRETRNELAWAVADCEPGAFPGSAEWKKEHKALTALQAFDLAHPEVLAEIRQADYDEHLAGKDLLGI